MIPRLLKTQARCRAELPGLCCFVRRALFPKNRCSDPRSQWRMIQLTAQRITSASRMLVLGSESRESQQYSVVAAGFVAGLGRRKSMELHPGVGTSGAWCQGLNSACKSSESRMFCMGIRVTDEVPTKTQSRHVVHAL
ncbi:hypothetical protein BJY00DRAFT_290063 [Aspergillus carlsbadensis]|nr:hypothetical protein BJY00DRAFT_290063 [Aspergillus carlsbadensis]